MDLSKEFEEHRHYLVSYAKKYLKNDEDAEDALQDTFIKACESMDSFNNGSTVRTWLTTLCKNICLNKLRKTKVENKKISEAIEDDRLDIATPEHYLEAEDSGKSMLAMWSGLPEHIQQAMNYKYLQDLSYKEIAEKMDAPVSTVKTWVRRGRLTLSSTISPQ